jgi:hypothetical protein
MERLAPFLMAGLIQDSMVDGHIFLFMKSASSWITSSTPIKQFQSNFNTRDLLRNGATVLGPSFPNAPLYVRREFLVNLPSNNGSWAIEGRVFSTE